MNKIWNKILNFFKWILFQLKDWHNLVILAVVTPLLFCLSILLIAFGLFFADGKIHLILATSTALAFWAGPFTPFWPLCIGITLGIRKFIDSIWKPKHIKQKEDRE